MSGHRLVLWFRNDLRLTDNAIVHQAAQLIQKKQASEVVPLYCFDPRQYIATPWGNPKTGAHHASFLLQSVLDLKQRLRDIGSDLVIHMGKPEEAIQGLCREGQQLTVLAQMEVTKEELDVDEGVRAALGSRGRLQLLWGNTLYHKDDLPFRSDMSELPDVFTPFKQKVEARCEVRAPLPAPKEGALPLAADLDPARLSRKPSCVEDLNAVVPEGAPRLASLPRHPNAAIAFEGGETAALRRLKHYLWDTGCISTYFDTRNGMLGADYSTKFSPWLARGCISPSTIFHEARAFLTLAAAEIVKRYEEQHGSNKSTYWVIFELTWRDFFRYFTIKHGSAIFYKHGVTGQPRQWVNDLELFRRWRDGRTGMPLVDANMREMKATGFMSNRGRQNVASYLTLDLGLDWRKREETGAKATDVLQGADWFESALVDYDVCSNWGNWVAAAGLTGGRINHFNITKQSKDYDEKGDYIRTWVPELAKVPAPSLFEPWRLSREDQAKFGVQIGVDYPEPPKSRYTSNGSFGGGSGSRGGGGRGRGNGSFGRGGGRNSRHGGDKKQKPRSDFERYG
ncbi:cryptochrome [Coccomyxa subellipsoidea C-169]|uniref:Cryptochrome DASH n=1 Tax=Coccomyxa subellipsoidea (strain C-169) TaxID=574566 RepID=I0YUW2_COCSC|nr:cryptochrome [Coccomyxa subellipsoidea C-169]EIE22181.1 cryptochrome [Coccomyxa subellipsoidea C-169]|eukprot:XP_005646725.1 cryptochrome [Coccomyxa subellipsoidea C-169]